MRTSGIRCLVAAVVVNPTCHEDVMDFYGSQVSAVSDFCRAGTAPAAIFSC
jgi:hypothetical protein